MSSEWPITKLGNLVEIKHGYAFKGEFFLDAQTSYQLTTPGNFAIGGGFQSEKVKYYNGPVPSDFVLNAGDLLVTMTDLSKAADTLGYAAKVPPTAGVTWLHNQRVGLVILKSGAKASKDFLHYLMRSPNYRHWVVSTATGSTVKHTSPSRICDYEFLLPPIDVQQEIATTLDALDDRITLLREANATLEAIAQALFKSWFVDFDPVRAKMAGRVPEGMDEATAALFPNIADDLQNFLSRPTASKLIAEGALLIGDGYRAKNNELGLPGVAFVRAGDLDSGQITPTKDFLASPALGAAASKMAIPGDTAFTSKGTIGRFAFVDSSAGDAVYSPQVCFWRSLDRRVIEPAYLHYWMKSAAFNNQVDAVRGQAAIMDYVSLSDQRKMKVDLPSVDLQRRFAEVITPLLDRIACNRATAMDLSSIRDVLIPRLISGQLRLPEAQALLEEAA